MSDGVLIELIHLVPSVMWPVVLTVGRYEPHRGLPPFAFGITNRVDEVLNLLFDALERVRG